MLEPASKFDEAFFNAESWLEGSPFFEPDPEGSSELAALSSAAACLASRIRPLSSPMSLCMSPDATAYSFGFPAFSASPINSCHWSNGVTGFCTRHTTSSSSALLSPSNLPLPSRATASIHLWNRSN